MSNGFFSAQPDYLKFISSLSLGTIIVFLLAGVLYFQYDERKENDLRSSEDKRLFLGIMEKSFENAEQYRRNTEARAAEFVAQHANLVQIMRQQKELLKEIKRREEKRLELLKTVVQEENRKLLEILSVSLRERPRIREKQERR